MKGLSAALLLDTQRVLHAQQRPLSRGARCCAQLPGQCTAAAQRPRSMLLRPQAVRQPSWAASAVGVRDCASGARARCAAAPTFRAPARPAPPSRHALRFQRGPSSSCPSSCIPAELPAAPPPSLTS